MLSRYCPSCGAPALADDVFCGRCGVALETLPPPPSQPAVSSARSGATGGGPMPSGAAPAWPASAASAAAARSGYVATSAVGPMQSARPIAVAAPPASAGRAVGVTIGVIALAMLLLLFQVGSLLLLIADALRPGGLHRVPASVVLVALVPAPLAIALAFWLGVVLFAFIGPVRAWLVAIATTQLLFDVTTLLQTRAFALYLRQGALLPTQTIGATRSVVLMLTFIHTLTACVLGLALAHAFAPWASVRARGQRGLGRWLVAALIGSVLALVAIELVHGSIVRLAATQALGPANTWPLDITLTALVIVLCGTIGGAVGWSLARDAR